MESSLPAVILSAARRHPNRAAVLAGGEARTYAELASAIEDVAARVAALGLSGERVGVLLPNIGAFPEVLYGLLRAGARAVMLNPLNSPREIDEYLDDAGARVVITVPALQALVPASVRTLLVDRGDTRWRLTDAHGTELAPTALPEDPGEPDDEAIVVYTAAHSGWARGARLSHRNLIANLYSTVEAMGVTSEDRVIAMLPLVHTFGLTVTLDAPLAQGATVLPLERFNPMRALELFAAERVTVVSGVPVMFAALLSAADRKGIPGHALRLAISGGAPLPLEIARRWQDVFGIPLRQGYGLTEAGPVCLFNRIDRPNHPGTLGNAFPGVEVSIRDEQGTELPDGETGEICARGENIFLGYIGDDGRHPGDFHGDWLRTGDLGSVEAERTVRFRGLLKPVFLRNGFNVYPHELQRVLEEDPRIERVQVCAIPDPVRDSDVVVAVWPARGAALEEEDVRALCKDRLAAYKQPSRIDVFG